jgi:MFS family permease
MSDAADAIPSHRREPRSVQHYIDELPMWADGTSLASVPMTLMQWRIWALAACGKFFVGFIIFVTGVALPLISHEFGIPPAQYGLISAASLFGILIGAAGLGGLSDYFGRKTMFIAEMFIFMAFLVALVLSNNFALLIFCLFGLGLGLARGAIIPRISSSRRISARPTAAVLCLPPIRSRPSAR